MESYLVWAGEGNHPVEIGTEQEKQAEDGDYVCFQ